MKNSQTKPFRQTKIVFFFSLLGVVISAGIYMYIFHMITTIEQETSVLIQDTNTLSAKESQIGVLKKNLQANQEREPALLSYFIDANDIVPFLETIEGYGRSTNVAVQFSTVDIKPAPDQLVASFKGVGSFTNLYRFMALLEAAPYEFTINNATIQSSGSPSGVAVKGQPAPGISWEADISLSVTSVSGVPKASVAQ